MKGLTRKFVVDAMGIDTDAPTYSVICTTLFEDKKTAIEVRDEITQQQDQSHRLSKLVDYLHALYLSEQLEKTSPTWLTVLIRDWVMNGETKNLSPELMIILGVSS